MLKKCDELPPLQKNGVPSTPSKKKNSNKNKNDTMGTTSNLLSWALL